MSSIPYSGGTIVDTTFTGDTRANIVSNIIAQLVNAGWTSISGSGTDQVLQSAATADGNSICMRVYDPGSGNCARILMRDAAGTRISNDTYLLPGASKTFRIIACKYNFFVFTPGTSAAREFVCGGTLALPAWLSGVITGDFGFLQGNSDSDTNATVGHSFRTRLCTNGSSSPNRGSGLVNGNLMNFSNNNTVGPQTLVCRLPAILNAGALLAYRWMDDTQRSQEAEIAWGLTSYNDEPKSYGFIHNCMTLSAPYAADDRSISSYDGHAWHAVTNNNGGQNAVSAAGTLLVAIT
jgi:hypothetical protein